MAITAQLREQRLTERSIPETALPVLVPCEPTGADGAIVRFRLNPFGLAERPVRQVKRPASLAGLPLWSAQLAETTELVLAIENQDQAAIWERIAQIDEPSLELEKPENMLRYLAASLAGGMASVGGNVQFVMWLDYKQRQLRTGLLCPNERTASFALLMYNANLSAARCRRCRRWFRRDEWHPQKYCSIRCRNAASIAAFRSRERRSRKRSKSQSKRRARR